MGLKIGSGQMVMQVAACLWFGGLNPGKADTAATPLPASTDQDSNRRP